MSRIPLKSERLYSSVLKATGEAVLQSQCETVLQWSGFYRRTPKMIEAVAAGKMANFKGWFIHLHKAQGNSILLDLLILHKDGRYVEIELKTAEGKLTKCQREILAVSTGHGTSDLVRSLDSFKARLDIFLREAARGL